MTIVERLLGYRMRKMINGKEPLGIMLSWKHQRLIEKWVDKSNMKLDCLKCIAGYRILGMNIVNIGY